MAEMSKRRYRLKKCIPPTLICVSANITPQKWFGKFLLKCIYQIYIYITYIYNCKILNFTQSKSCIRQEEAPACGVLYKPYE